MTISLRHARVSDVPAALQLCRTAGWNQQAEDWLRLLAFEPNGCFAAESDGKLIGTVTTTCYGTRLAWIGMMLVHPDHRRRGVATRLMNRALQYLDEREIECVKLDATPEGHHVYEQLGFVAECSLQRWTRDGSLNTTTDRPEPDAISPPMRNLLRQLDRETFGVDRWNWIERLVPGSMVRCHRRAMGMLRPGFLASYLGPVIASDPHDAGEVIRQLIQTTTSPVFWDIPVPNEIAAELAGKLEFDVARELIRMRLGAETIDSDPHRLFALADPSTG